MLVTLVLTLTILCATYGSGSTPAPPECVTLAGAQSLDSFPIELDHELTIALLQDLHPGPGIAGPFLPEKQLLGAPLEFDRVVPGLLSGVLEAENPFQEDG